MKQHEQVKKKITAITEKLGQEPGNAGLLFERSQLWEQIGAVGNALNDLYEILKSDPGNLRAKNRISYLETILKYRNTDIFSDTNTHHDPWEE